MDFLRSDLEKKRGKKCSTGQRFICTEVTSNEIHTLVLLKKWADKMQAAAYNEAGTLLWYDGGAGGGTHPPGAIGSGL